jgi:mannose-6-phosphate isomerase-like protein (cupin superfamily)
MPVFAADSLEGRPGWVAPRTDRVVLSRSARRRSAQPPTDDVGVELDAVGAAAPRNQAQVLRIAGHWHATPDLGLFWVRPDQPLEIHYHDFDEYWVILHGRSPAVIDGAPAAVGPGQLIATAAGYEHGIPQPDGELVGLSFCLERSAAARLGHLHRDVEGPPVPSRR